MLPPRIFSERGDILRFELLLRGNIVLTVFAGRPLVGASIIVLHWTIVDVGHVVAQVSQPATFHTSVV